MFITFIIFTASPLIILQIIPSEIMNVLALQGLNLNDLLTKFALLGLAMSFLTFLKGFTEETSLSHLLISLSSNIFWLVITFFGLGFGNIEALGITVISFEISGISNIVTIDLRVFVYFTILTTFLRVIHSILNYKQGMLKK